MHVNETRSLWFPSKVNICVVASNRSFQPYYVLLVSLSSVRCIKKWFVSVDVSNRADFVCKSSRIEWTEWNEMKWMAEWIRSMGRCIYGFSNCGSAMQMCGGWNDTRVTVQPKWVQCVRLLYGNPCAINSFRAFPFWSITPCKHIRTRFAKSALL